LIDPLSYGYTYLRTDIKICGAVSGGGEIK